MAHKSLFKKRTLGFALQKILLEKSYPEAKCIIKNGVLIWEGIVRPTLLSRKYNIKIVCMSFGSEPAEKYDPLVVGAESLWNSGVCVVVAAGNSGPDKSSIRSPGISRKVITVGGFDDRKSNDNQSKNYTVADFSSRGPVGNIYKPDLVAPAVNIVGANRLGGYTTMSGTSVATPFIAGIASLMTSKYPRLTPDQIKIRIVRCCTKISFDQNEDGFGVVDCGRLFKN